MCLRDPAWNFCDSFPELCISRPVTHFKTKDEIAKDICAADPTACEVGSVDEVNNATDVCAKYDNLSDDLKTKTSVKSYCDANPDILCKLPELNNATNPACENGELKNFCALFPNKCLHTHAEFDICAVEIV
jgi:hypothetical protein